MASTLVVFIESATTLHIIWCRCCRSSCIVNNFADGQSSGFYQSCDSQCYAFCGYSTMLHWAREHARRRESAGYRESTITSEQGEGMKENSFCDKGCVRGKRKRRVCGRETKDGSTLVWGSRNDQKEEYWGRGGRKKGFSCRRSSGWEDKKWCSMRRSVSMLIRGNCSLWQHILRS